MASAENDGCFVSNEFPCFDVDHNSACPEYLWYYFSRESAWNEAFGLSYGVTSTSRNRLKEKNLLNLSIPLPPILEQRCIVEKIERLVGQMAEARELREKVAIQLDQLCRSILNATEGELVETPMSELVTWRKPDIDVQATESYHFAGVYCFGRGVFKGDRKTGMEFSYAKLTRLKAGEFVYPKLMAWEGALGAVPEECDGLYVSPEYPVFEINESKVLPEVLDVYFTSPAIWPKLSGSPKFLEDFRKDFEAEKIELDENFRCSQEVVSAARRLNPSYSVQGQLPIKGLSLIEECDSEESEAEYVAETIEELIENGHPDIEGTLTLERIAILGRNRFAFRSIEEELKEREINHYKKLSSTAYQSESDIVQQFELALRVRANPFDKLHLSALGQMWDVDHRTSENIANKVTRDIDGLVVLEEMAGQANDDHSNTIWAFVFSVFKISLVGWSASKC